MQLRFLFHHLCEAMTLVTVCLMLLTIPVQLMNLMMMADFSWPL